MNSADTIVARASAAGRGGVAVVRVSGPETASMVAAVAGDLPRPREAVLREFHDTDGTLIDTGLVLWFPAPRSFTGEDVAEFQGHGGRVVVDLLIARLCSLGARPARPGEFSERAFLNDKLDLAQAEAIADLVDSGSAQAARAAVRSLQGAFSQVVHAIVEQITTLRMHVEAAIDFPEEEIDFLDDAGLRARLDQTRDAFDALQRRAQQGRALNDGLTVVLAGAPNVGKSSLLNALSGDDTAIVTDIAGTTRDLIETTLDVAGLPVTLIDTAGLRETDDVVEREGVRRSRQAAARADHLLVMVEATGDPLAQADALAELLPDDIPRTLVVNKIDLVEAPLLLDTGDASAVPVSATRGDGVASLQQRLHEAAGLAGDIGGGFSARRRHLECIETARAHFDAGVARLEQDRAGELMAEELRLAQQALSEITGAFTSDDLLGRIFSSFCIGK
ncbi:MAG: tRNA uridine-5-carboxymethylaminomethyl(34) synthesis GTPase MnmE [Pseudomonadota bacterium]